MARIEVTLFVEVQSSWCFWFETAWAALKERYRDTAHFGWGIALMLTAAFPSSREQCDVFYRRSGVALQSDFMLNSAWLEEELAGDYSISNYVAEAGKDFGVEGDALRVALARAALVDGRKIGRIDEAVAVATAECGLDAGTLKEKALSAAIRERVEQSTQKFHALQIDQRPSVLIVSDIGDRALFSGVVRIEPLVATIEAMLKDRRAYASYRAHYGEI
ncbi:MAG: DsbA family oxidoreductase [Candidatus Latescibacterota bacterium]|jgi:predicted DsbA family dithiol-disulfide isomerase